MVGRAAAWKETAIVAAAWATAGLWLLMPFDPVPDFLPLVGWVDDLLMLVGVGGMTAWWAQRRFTALPEVAAPPRLPERAADYDPVPTDQLEDW